MGQHDIIVTVVVVVGGCLASAGMTTIAYVVLFLLPASEGAVEDALRARDQLRPGLPDLAGEIDRLPPVGAALEAGEEAQAAARLPLPHATRPVDVGEEPATATTSEQGADAAAAYIAVIVLCTLRDTHPHVSGTAVAGDQGVEDLAGATDCTDLGAAGSAPHVEGLAHARVGLVDAAHHVPDGVALELPGLGDRDSAQACGDADGALSPCGISAADKVVETANTHGEGV